MACTADRIPVRILLDPDIHVRLAAQAKREDRSAVSLLRFALRQYLDAAEQYYLDPPTPRSGTRDGE